MSDQKIEINVRVNPLSLDLLDKLKTIHTNIRTTGPINSGDIVISNVWETLKDLREPVTSIYLYENKNIWLKKKDKQIADAVFPMDLIKNDPGIILHAILQLAYRKNREYHLHCELQEEKKKRIYLEGKIQHFKNDIASTVITPINAISDKIAVLLENESFTDDVKNVLVEVVENLKNSSINKPDFLHLFEKLLDANIDRETKSWLATEVLRDTPESVSFEMQRNRRRASSLGLLYWKDRKHSFNKSEKSRLRDAQKVDQSPTESAEYSLDDLNHVFIDKPIHSEYHQGMSLLTNTLSEQSRDPELLNSQYSQLLNVPQLPFNSQHIKDLGHWSFQVFDHSSSQLILYLVDMFDSLNFLTLAKISRSTFSEFCCSVFRGYTVKLNPYHNFQHAFDVTHSGYLLLTKYMDSAPFGFFTPNEAFAFLLSCLCHDLGHDGRSNTFHISTISPLALLYNDQSPLENYHCHQAFLLLNEFDILTHFETEDRLLIRSVIIRCILATDLSKHVTVLGKFNEITQSIKPLDKEHRTRCLEVLMKCADISNVLRPIPLAKKWGEAIQVLSIHLGRDV